ncbi:hypothetical protein A7982_13433 [Minicystis rosea]|nr:hypothetical protein A7982_13433 [Minicystis rosea]
MVVPVPFSPAYAGLALALPGVWLLARAMAHRVTRDLGLRTILPIGLGIALWVVSVQLASQAAGSFRIGLPVGTLAASFAGIVAEIARRRTDTAPPTGHRPPVWMWITAVATAAAIVPAAFQYWFHDELLLAGHMSTVAQLQAGVFPPRRLQFPEYSFRYHYGFDLLSASFSAILHVPVDTGIDVASIVLWAASWCLLWGLGERLIGRRRAWLAPVMTLFASGLPLGCPHDGSLLPNMISECPVGHWSVNGPVITYFFQHPWALGIPVATTAILVFTERHPHSAWARFGALAFLFGALSFSELVLYVTVLPSLLVAEVWYEEGLEIRRALPMLGAMLLSLGLARLLGGFFAPANGLVSMQFVLHPGFADTPKLTLAWNAMTFGAMWITGVLGFFALRRGRLLFGLLFAGALLVVNGVRYTGSADIMKFATVVSLALGFMGSAAIARLLPSKPWSASWPRTVTAFSLFAAATWIGFGYPIIFALHLGDIPGSFRSKPETMPDNDVHAAVFLRARIREGGLVYRSGHLGYSQWAGLPQPWLDWTSKTWGVPPEKMAAREKLLKGKPTEVAPYREQGFRFFVLDEAAKDDKSLVEASNTWVARGQAKIAARFGMLRVVDLGREGGPATSSTSP